jgi:hypothetical protein
MAARSDKQLESDVLSDIDLRHADLARRVEAMRSDLRDIARAVAYLSQRVAPPGVAERPLETPPVPKGPSGFDQLKLLVEDWGEPDAA